MSWLEAFAYARFERANGILLPPTTATLRGAPFITYPLSCGRAGPAPRCRSEAPPPAQPRACPCAATSARVTPPPPAGRSRAPEPPRPHGRGAGSAGAQRPVPPRPPRAARGARPPGAPPRRRPEASRRTGRAMRRGRGRRRRRRPARRGRGRRGAARPGRRRPQRPPAAPPPRAPCRRGRGAPCCRSRCRGAASSRRPPRPRRPSSRRRTRARRTAPAPPPAPAARARRAEGVHQRLRVRTQPGAERVHELDHGLRARRAEPAVLLVPAALALDRRQRVEAAELVEQALGRRVLAVLHGGGERLEHHQVCPRPGRGDNVVLAVHEHLERVAPAVDPGPKPPRHSGQHVVVAPAEHLELGGAVEQVALVVSPWQELVAEPPEQLP